MVMRVENVFEWMVLTKRVVGIRPNHSLNIMSSMMMMMMMMVMMMIRVVMVMEIISMTFKSVGDLVILHQIVSAGQILRAGRWVTFHLYSILGGVAQNPTCFGNSPKGVNLVGNVSTNIRKLGLYNTGGNLIFEMSA